MSLIDGQTYCLPNGEKVTARLIEERFILEFKRQYRAPLSVGSDGTLFLRGESTGLTLDSLAVVQPGNAVNSEE
jgi:hypothetical protein